MKVHPKPMIRHNSNPVHCDIIVTTGQTGADTVHVVININGATQRLIMTPGEARSFASCLTKTADEVGAA